MNATERGPYQLDDNARFDRLVDGELPPDEYRALVASLDDEPGSWRRCALAFLEAQALKSELSELRGRLNGGDSAGKGASDVCSTAAANRRSSVPLRTILSLAASLLLAFGLGTVTPRFFSRGQQDEPGLGNRNLVPHVAELDRPSSGDGSDARHQALRPVANVQLVVDGPDGRATQAAEVPVFEWDRRFEQLLADDPPTLRPEVLEYLRSIGHEVVGRHELVPGRLDDGRPVVVPVERYEITPGRRRSY